MAAKRRIGSRRKSKSRHLLRAEGLEERMMLSGTTGDLPVPAEFSEINSSQLENQQVTSDPQVQQQPTIAVNSLDPNHVVIAYHDESLVEGAGRFGIGISVSRDGGNTFSHSSVALPAELNETTGAGLPVLQFDADGRLYVFFDALSSAGAGFSPAGFGSFEIGGGVFLAHSDDGGTTWSDLRPIEFEAFAGTPVAGVIGNDFAVDAFRFMPDGSPNPHFGNLYATWQTFPHDDTFGVRLAVSRDGGTSWEMQDLETPESADFDVLRQGVLGRARITIGPDGTVFISLFSAGRFRRSPLG